MYLNVAEEKRPQRRLSGDDDKKQQINVNVSGSEPVMAALPWMGASGALLVGTAILPKEPQWAKITKLVLAAAGAGTAIYGVVTAIQTQKSMQPTGPIGPGSVPKGQLVPSLAPGRLSEIMKIDFDPEQRETGGTTRSTFADQEYEATIKNDSNQTLSFYPAIAVRDSDQKLKFRTPSLQRQMMTLQAQESRTVGTKARADQTKRPENEPVFRVPSSAIAWTPETHTVEVELYRNRDDKDPFMMAMIPIKYSYYGWPNA